MFKRKYTSHLISEEVIPSETTYIYINKSSSPTRIKTYKGSKKLRRQSYIQKNWYQLSLIGLMTIILALVW